MQKIKKIIFWCFVGFTLIQFIPIDMVNKPIDVNKNFIDVKKTPENVAAIIRNACYDCHSDETIYPKYAHIAPISWSIKSHINDGRKYLNFSIWESYNSDMKTSMLKNSIQTVDSKVMPLPAYIIYHKDANLSDAKRKMLITYFETMLESKEY